MKRTIVLLCLLVLGRFAQSLPAQTLIWTPIGTFSSRIGTVYFFDEITGFVSLAAVPGGSTTPGLLKTTDGGLTWVPVVVENLSGNYGIQDIFMVDRNNGYACGSLGSTSVWKTVDGGQHWKALVNESKLGVSIRQAAAGVLVTNFYGADIQASKDGTNFTSVFSSQEHDSFLGMDFSDAFHGVAVGSYRSTAPWFYTEDGGATWNPTQVNMETWSVYGPPNTTNFFAVPEEWSNGPLNTPSSCYRSTDYGKTWSIVSSFKQRMIGTVTGIKDILYTQTLFGNGEQQGIFRSLDSGVTWTFIGGPNQQNDTRFVVVPKNCSTAVIIAGGDDNILYKAYEDLSISKIPGVKSLVTSTSVIDLDTLSFCKEIDTTITLYNSSCSKLQIFGIKSTGTGFTIPDTSCTIPPYGYIRITLHTHADTTGHSSQNGGSISILSDADVTVLPISFARAFIFPHSYTASQKAVNFGTVSFCSERDTSFMIHSTGCDTLHIRSITATGGVSVRDTILALAPGDSLNVVVHTRADTTNGQTINNGTVIISSDDDNTHPPITFQRTITYPHIGTAGAGVLSLGSTTYCTEFDTAFTITSTGCDTLHITGIKTDKGISISDTILAIPPGESARIPIHVKADTSFHQVTNSGSIIVSSDATPPISSPFFTYSIIYPTPYSLTATSMNLGTTAPCTEIDTVITLRSVGCDTINLHHVSVGSGFTVRDTSILLIPGDSVQIIVHTKSDTTGHQTTNTATVTFTSSPSIAGVRVTRRLSYLPGATLSQQSFDFGTSSLCIDHDTTLLITNSNCDSIHITGVYSIGAGFSVRDSSFSIPPGGVASVRIHSSADTSGQSTYNTGSLTIKADVPFSTVSLRRGIIYPPQYRIRLVLGLSAGKNKMEVPVYLIADSLPAGVTRIDALLHIGDTDLLTPIDHSSKDSLVISGDSIAIIGSPVLTSGDTLATFIYKNFLSVDSATSLSLSAVTYHGTNSSAPCEGTLLGTELLPYDFIYSCGEITIAKLLRHEPIVISSITPNPTQRDIIVIVQSPVLIEGTIAVYDLVGKKVVSESIELSVGKSTHHIDIAAYPEGIYSVVVSTALSKTNATFIKE